MKKLDYQKMIEWLAVILRCPVCQNKYSAEQTSILETREAKEYDNSAMLVHTDCEMCKSSVVFSIAVDGPEVFSVGMVTDLTAYDARKFRANEVITPDEVIEFHQFLGNFDGNFERILM